MIYYWTTVCWLLFKGDCLHGARILQVDAIHIVTAMMPKSIQELVYTGFGSGAVNYEETFAKIRALVSNKVAIAGWRSG